LFNIYTLRVIIGFVAVGMPVGYQALFPEDICTLDDSVDLGTIYLELELELSELVSFMAFAISMFKGQSMLRTL